MDDLLLDNNLLNSYKAFTGSHFMFNVINAIQSDLLLTKNKEAFQTLQTFNRLYKYAVKCSNEQYTTLEDEIQFLNQYLSMEQIRFSSSHFPKSISVGSFPPETLIPTYVFQPLVENAILLSLENKAKNLQNGRRLTLANRFRNCPSLLSPKNLTNKPSKFRTPLWA